MKLFLHVGTPKTASTYLQNTCAANPDWLAQNGFFYPDLMSHNANHITLLYAAAETISSFAKGFGLKTEQDVEAFREKLSKRIEKQIEMAPSNVHTMLMSSENLTGNMRLPGVRRLAEFLKPHFDEIKIVFYLRRQDDAILSMYGEFMRKGFSNDSFEKFVKHAMSPAVGPPYLFSRRMLTEWTEVFGRDAITVRLYDRQQLVGGNILEDFMLQALEAKTVDVTGLTPSKEANVGLSAPALEFLRRLQPAIPFEKDGNVNPNRGRLEPRINKLPSEPRPKMSAHQSQQIMKNFAGVNAWVRDAFFPDHKGPLFPLREDLDENGNVGKVSLKDFADYTRHLLR